MPPKLALARYPLTRTTSLEEARSLYGRLNTPITIEPTERRTPFEWRSNQIAIGPLALSTSWYRSGVHAWTDAVEDIFSVTLPCGGGGAITHGGEVVPLLKERAGFIASPLQPTDVKLGANFQSIRLVTKRATMEALLAAPWRSSGQDACITDLHFGGVPVHYARELATWAKECLCSPMVEAIDRRSIFVLKLRVQIPL